MSPSAVRPVPSRRRPQEGFTLLELMVIVVIIMTLTALLAPSAVRAFATFRAQAASLEVLRMARIARREAMEGGRAIVVRSVNGATGRHVEVRRGDTNLCRTASWATIFSRPCLEPSHLDDPAAGCLGYVDPGMFGVGTHTVTITALDAGDVCYQPNGEALVTTATGGVVFSRPAAGASAISYAVERLEHGGAIAEPIRTIIIPFDSSPRSVR